MGINYQELKGILEKKANMAISHLDELKCFVPEFKTVLDSVLYISETLNDLKFLDTECPHCKKEAQEAPATPEEPKQQTPPGQSSIGRAFEDGDNELNSRLVLFYSDSCEPCQKLKPVIEQVAEEEGIYLQAVCVDQPEGIALAEKYEVRGWPTFFMVVNGIIKETNSGYDMDGTEESNKGRVLHTITKGFGQ
jgi:thioredoxin 1